MEAKVYFNLHKKCWSVLTRTPKGWRLAFHAGEIAMDNVTWKVSEAGRQRVIREQRKNVHAFGVGTLSDIFCPIPDPSWKPVRYNPYKCASFCVDGQPITKSEHVKFNRDRSVLACGNS
jgi:hypothetical protein